MYLSPTLTNRKSLYGKESHNKDDIQSRGLPWGGLGIYIVTLCIISKLQQNTCIVCGATINNSIPLSVSMMGTCYSEWG